MIKHMISTVRNIKPTPAVLKTKSGDIPMSKPLVMGVLNLTPDSFYAESRCASVDESLFRVENMLDEGADIVDMGAESTRPGSIPVSEKEETKRLIPVLEQCVKKFGDSIFSVDTTKAAVAQRALESGASIINDISGLAFEPSIAKCVAEADAAIVVSHTPERPGKMQSRTDYTCVVRDVIKSLKQSVEKAVNAGVRIESIVIDPGIGFGKTQNQNLEILNRLDEFFEIGRPVLVGTSRKSFIGGVLGGLPAEERIEGTAATVTVAVTKGAQIVRVHDVKEMARVATMSYAIKSGMAA